MKSTYFEIDSNAVVQHFLKAIKYCNEVTVHLKIVPNTDVLWDMEVTTNE